MPKADEQVLILPDEKEIIRKLYRVATDERLFNLVYRPIGRYSKAKLYPTDLVNIVYRAFSQEISSGRISPVVYAEIPKFIRALAEGLVDEDFIQKALRIFHQWNKTVLTRMRFSKV